MVSLKFESITLYKDAKKEEITRELKFQSFSKNVRFDFIISI